MSIVKGEGPLGYMNDSMPDPFKKGTQCFACQASKGDSVLRLHLAAEVDNFLLFVQFAMAITLNFIRLYLQLNWRRKLTESYVFLSDSVSLCEMAMFSRTLILCGFDT